MKSCPCCPPQRFEQTILNEAELRRVDAQPGFIQLEIEAVGRRVRLDSGFESDDLARCRLDIRIKPGAHAGQHRGAERRRLFDARHLYRYPEDVSNDLRHSAPLAAPPVNTASPIVLVVTC